MDEFTRAVFDAVYRSPKQRLLRALFVNILALKHVLRGIAFSWPLYLLSGAGLALPGEYAWLFQLLLIPALIVSASILLIGLSEEYQGHVQGRLIKPGDWKNMIIGKFP